MNGNSKYASTGAGAGREAGPGAAGQEQQGVSAGTENGAAAASGAAHARASTGTDETRLVWVDMEMTGLRPEIDRIIEVAVVITDSDLNPVAEGPVLVIHQPDSVLDAMDAWNLSLIHI